MQFFLKNYVPAQIKMTKSLGLYIEYYIFDPVEDQMVRKRIKLGRATRSMKTKKEKLAFASQVCDDVNRKLGNGWSPYNESDDARLYTPMREAADAYLAAKRREGLRATSLTNYASFVRQFLEWLECYAPRARYTGTFLHRDAVVLMDYRMGLENGNRTYNNFLKGMRAFFSWLVEHCYCRENPFVGIKLMKKEAKKRELVGSEDRRRALEWFDDKVPQMGLFCMLVFYALIRPYEANRIRIADIDLANHRIIIPEEHAKNGKRRSATVSGEICERLSELLGEGCYSEEWYLFGEGKRLMPGPKPHPRSYFGKLWRKMRGECGMPDSFQLYSLRDSGITEFIHSGVDPLTVQHHADHSSLEIQAIYTNHFDKELNRKIFESDVEF